MLGQPVSAGAGRPRAFLGTSVAAHLRAALEAARRVALPRVAPTDERLVERRSTPRAGVPLAFRLSALWSLSWWEMFGILMVAAAPIAVWIVPPRDPPGGPGPRSRRGLPAPWLRYRRRIGLLKHGKVATITNSGEVSRGTYYSGTTYQNMRVAQATGWDVTRSYYSGPASVTELSYVVDGVPGTREAARAPVRRRRGPRGPASTRPGAVRERVPALREARRPR